MNIHESQNQRVCEEREMFQEFLLGGKKTHKRSFWVKNRSNFSFLYEMIKIQQSSSYTTLAWIIHQSLS